MPVPALNPLRFSRGSPFLSQLAGRVLLIFLFIGFIIQGNWSIARVLVSVLGFGACVMVAVGFKARWSASFLVLLLSVFNVSRWHASRAVEEAHG